MLPAQPGTPAGRSGSAGAGTAYCRLYGVATPALPVSHTRLSTGARESLLWSLSPWGRNDHRPEGYWLFGLQESDTFCANK